MLQDQANFYSKPPRLPIDKEIYQKVLLHVGIRANIEGKSES